jgi:universal stress protein A
MLVKRILVPIDFSPDSLNALAYATEFAAAFGAEILLLYVIEPIYYAAPADMYAVNTNVAALLGEQRHAAEEQFARIVAKQGNKGPRLRTLIKTGTASEVIVERAKAERVGLIILATHGRTGLAHMFMGSVAEKVVRTASCPVLTVRGKQKSAKKR